MSETPYSPAEEPGDDDWTSPAQSSQPRYSASASVPAPPAAPPAQPVSQFGQGSAFGQGGQGMGQPPAPGAMGQPPAGLGQPPAQSSMGQARVAGSASVPAPAAPPSYGAPPQGYPAQASAYGTPGGGAQYGSPAPTYGSAPAAAAQTYGSAPAAQPYGSAPAPAAQTYGSAPAAPAQPGYGSALSGFGQPQGGGSTFGQPGGQGGSSGQPYGGNPGPGQYGQPQGGSLPTYGSADRGGNYGQAPGPDQRNWSEEDEPNAPAAAARPKRGLIIALLATVLVVVVGIGGYVGWSMTHHGADFAVGNCVKQNGTSVAVVDCTTSGAFKITSLEDAVSKCPDPNQPSLSLSGTPAEHRYACLQPAAS
jgi:hypothetical protein